jgi:hypothetical protein
MRPQFSKVKERVMTQPAFRNRSGDADAGLPSDLSDEDRSKDKYFHEVAALSNSMIAAHGRDFAMGTLILAARFIAENKALTTAQPSQDAQKSEGAACCGGAHHHDHANSKS